MTKGNLDLTCDAAEQGYWTEQDMLNDERHQAGIEDMDIHEPYGPSGPDSEELE